MVEIEGQPWVIASDLYGSIGLRQWGGVLNPLDVSEKTLRGRTSVGLPPGRDVWLVSESGLYKLVMRSDKPEAKDFQNWVTRVVLPAIRKDGGYIHGEEHVVSGAMTEDELVKDTQDLGSVPSVAPLHRFLGRMPWLCGFRPGSFIATLKPLHQCNQIPDFVAEIHVDGRASGFLHRSCLRSRLICKGH